MKLGLELARTLQGAGWPHFSLAVAAAVEFYTINEHIMGVDLGAVRDLTRLGSIPCMEEVSRDGDMDCRGLAAALATAVVVKMFGWS